MPGKDVNRAVRSSDWSRDVNPEAIPTRLRGCA
ncbi:hypothetical protein ABIC30_000132 [Methylobacterium sp. 1030]|jgi:hypothetical protein|nr:hypothetical protein SAMN04488144_101393 [Methylobacterium sp. 190mf]